MGTVIGLWASFAVVGAALGAWIAQRRRWGLVGQLASGFVGLVIGGLAFLGFWALLFRACSVLHCGGSGLFVGT